MSLISLFSRRLTGASFLLGPRSLSGERRRVEITADFQRLNVLLLRAATGKMIGTALLTEARINATVANAGVSATGSLGGLQVRRRARLER